MRQLNFSFISRFSLIFALCFLTSLSIFVPSTLSQNKPLNKFNNYAEKQDVPVGLCGFGELYELFFKSKTPITIPTQEYLINRGKVDIFGNTITDQIGQQVDFWTWDFKNQTLEQIHATCQAVEANCYIYVDDMESIDQGIIENIKNEFDSHIYTTDRDNFGSEWKPGIDGDDKITILIYNIKDEYYYGQASSYIAGYFNPFDESQGEYSNEREMFYMDCNPGQPGSNTFYGVLAHEFQHMIHWNEDRDEEIWIDEGCAVYAEFICGYGVRYPQLFFTHPDNNLTVWTQQLDDYEQCFLWILYLYEQFGGKNTIKHLVQEQANGIQGIENTFQAKGYSAKFEDVFADWIVANFMDDTSIGNGKYGYNNIDLSSYSMSYAQNHNSYPTSSSGTVSQWASVYIKFTGGNDITFSYSGPSSAWLIETGGSDKKVEPLDGTKRVIDFGNLYDQVILTANGAASGGNYNYTATSSPNNYPNLTSYTGPGSNNTFSYDNSSHVCMFNISVQNNGVKPAGSFKLGCYLSADKIIDTNDHLICYKVESNLNNGDYLNLSCSKDLDDFSCTQLPSGTYYSGYYIDYEYTVSENNESDNMGLLSSQAINRDCGGDVVTIWIEENLICGCDNGDTFTAAVKIDDVTDKDIYAYRLEVTFNASDLEAISASSSNTITSGWGAPTVNIEAGKITLAAAGTSALSGSGDFVKINFKSVINHTNGQKVSLSFQNVQFNEGTPSTTTSYGWVTFQCNAEISGTVKYFQSGNPISNVTMNLTGGATQNKTTGSSGTYQFENLPAGQNYQVMASKSMSEGLESSISPFDASYVLRYYVGNFNLTEEQKIAADVSVNGEVTPFDASIILRYYVGQDVSQYNIAKWKFCVPPVTDWTIQNTSRNYTPLNSDQTNQDFTGVLVGDVTANWAASILSKTTTGSLVLGEVTHKEGNLLELSIRVEGVSSYYSIGIEMDTDGLVYESVTPVMASDKIVLAHNEDARKLRIALASSEKLEEGTLLKVLFQIEDDVFLAMTSFEIDANRVAGIKEEVSCLVDKIPVTYDLQQNYPNPFNPETRIVYILPEKSDVDISLYNMIGQKVRELVRASQERGEYEVIWDGRDETNGDVPSGIYFVKFNAKNFRKTMKIVKTK